MDAQIDNYMGMLFPDPTQIISINETGQKTLKPEPSKIEEAWQKMSEIESQESKLHSNLLKARSEIEVAIDLLKLINNKQLATVKREIDVQYGVGDGFLELKQADLTHCFDFFGRELEKLRIEVQEERDFVQSTIVPLVENNWAFRFYKELVVDIGYDGIHEESFENIKKSEKKTLHCKITRNSCTEIEQLELTASNNVHLQLLSARRSLMDTDLFAKLRKEVENSDFRFSENLDEIIISANNIFGNEESITVGLSNEKLMSSGERILGQFHSYFKDQKPLISVVNQFFHTQAVECLEQHFKSKSICINEHLHIFNIKNCQIRLDRLTLSMLKNGELKFKGNIYSDNFEIMHFESLLDE